MEESKKFFSQKAITIATYFGGPAAAGYLMKKNYQAVNQDDKAKKAFIIGVISTLLIFVIIFSIPERIMDEIPNAFIPMIYTGIIYLIVETLQGDMLKEHKDNEGEFYSGWKAAGIGAIFMGALLVIILAASYISGDLLLPNFDSASYDRGIAKFSENETNALAVYKVINTSEPQYLLKEFDKGLVLWKENKEIIGKLNSIDNLPQKFLNQNMNLLEYCNLRIQQSELIKKAISENTDRYVSDLDKISLRINEILDKLN